FVEDMARYGVHLHLGAAVDKLSIEPLIGNEFDPEYDTDLDTELVADDAAETIYVSKVKYWPKARAAIESRGHRVVIHGEPYQERVIFGVVPETAPARR
ncbi:MAG TPA: glycosyltransferase, partial [Dokdonella sp.]|nr:glycosyltransferase [Dokdonella sp.]